MEKASEELERRSRYLSSLIHQQRKKEEGAATVATVAVAAVTLKEAEEGRTEKLELKKSNSIVRTKEKEKKEEEDNKGVKNKKKVVEVGDRKQEKQQQLQKVRIRASDMSPELQKRAFRCACDVLASMPKLDSKRLALTLKKEFDSSYGPAWHCIVGTSFGSYVTHSLGGFLYFSIDKVYILLFRTAVEPLEKMTTPDRDFHK